MIDLIDLIDLFVIIFLIDLFVIIFLIKKLILIMVTINHRIKSIIVMRITN